MGWLARIGGFYSGLIFGSDGAEHRAAAERRAYNEDPSADASIDLMHYARTVLGHPRPIAICLVIAIFLSALYLNSANYLYTVTMQVTPVDNGQQSLNTSSVAGLASLAGINLPSSSGQSQLELYLAAINSADVASDMMKIPALTHVLFASSWDETSQSWREPPSATRPIKNAIREILGYPPARWEPPNTQSMMGLIERGVLVVHKPQSPIVTITYKNPDPRFAQRLLVALHRAADGRLRARVQQRTTQYIAYLTHELTTVTSAEHRAALINTLSDQEAKRMAASANMSYSVDVFSPPTASPGPTEPRPTVVILGAMLLGALAGIGLVLLRFR